MALRNQTSCYISRRSILAVGTVGHMHLFDSVSKRQTNQIRQTYRQPFSNWTRKSNPLRLQSGCLGVFRFRSFEFTVLTVWRRDGGVRSNALESIYAVTETNYLLHRPRRRGVAFSSAPLEEAERGIDNPFRLLLYICVRTLV